MPPDYPTGNGILLALDNNGTMTVSGPKFDNVFFLGSLGAINDRWFVQLIVEEVLNGAVVARAASRGTWFGVAP